MIINEEQIEQRIDRVNPVYKLVSYQLATKQHECNA